jgi:enoyl-CoA hydratase/carnithine racemase
MTDLVYDVDRQARVATILLNRPARKNAFTIPMIDEWLAALTEARDDPGVGAILLRGAGDAFCSGLDLSTVDDHGMTPLQRKEMLSEHVQHIPKLVAALDKPLIAAIRGVAVGAGMDMALMCDMRIASRTARFCESYIRVGLVPGAGGLYYLSRIVGVPKALELFLSGDFVDAAEAHRIGLVNRLVEDEELDAAAESFAAKLASGPPIATRMIKRALYQSARVDLETALDMISSHMAVVQSTEDSREALAAFGEKRKAVYQGR